MTALESQWHCLDATKLYVLARKLADSRFIVAEEEGLKYEWERQRSRS